MSSNVKPTRSSRSSRSTPGVRRAERPLALVGVGTALVLVTYVTPMSTVPQTVIDLGAGAGARAWILSSMSVGLAAALLATGAVGDATGRRRTYLAGLALMGVGSLLCGLAPGAGVFIGARVLEGVGGAAVLACGLALLAHAFPAPADRARAAGIWGASVGVGITVGALLAAVLEVGTGWRETYLVVGVLALALVVPSARGLPESAAERPRRLDTPGALTLAAALALLVSGLTEARAGLSPVATALLAVGALLVVVFVVVELRTREPMLEPALLRSPAFGAATLGALVSGLGIIGMTSNVPFLVQVGLGGTLWDATWLVLAWSATGVATSLLLRRVNAPVSGSTMLGLGMLVVGLAQLLALGVDAGSSAWRLAPSLLLAGLATGVVNASLGRQAVASVPPDRAAMGSGSNNTARYLGAAIGITLVSVILAAGASGDSGPGDLFAAWDRAVLVTSAFTLLGAALVLLLARRARVGDGPGPGGAGLPGLPGPAL